MYALLYVSRVATNMYEAGQWVYALLYVCRRVNNMYEAGQQQDCHELYLTLMSNLADTSLAVNALRKQTRKYTEHRANTMLQHALIACFNDSVQQSDLLETEMPLTESTCQAGDIQTKPVAAPSFSKSSFSI